jgi:hypothetical protein
MAGTRRMPGRRPARRTAPYPAGGRAGADADGDAHRARRWRRGDVRWTHTRTIWSRPRSPTPAFPRVPDERAASRGRTRVDLHRRAQPPADLAGPVRLRVHVGSSAASMHLHAAGRRRPTAPPACWSAAGPRAGPRPRRRGGDLAGHTGYRLQPAPAACTRLQRLPPHLWHPGTGENPGHAIRGQRNEQTLVTAARSPRTCPSPCPGTPSVGGDGMQRRRRPGP